MKAKKKTLLLRTGNFVEMNDKLREIFDCIFDDPMSQFNGALEFIRTNAYGLVWREENERNTKVIFHAKTFIRAITTSFPTKHAEAAKHIEGSTCDLFLQYIYNKLDESLLGQDPFHDSCKETKKLVKNKILRIKSELETKTDEQPANKSDLEIMISQTDLLDPIHIRHALLCCQIANDCDDPENSKNFLDSLKKEHLLSGLCVSYENKHVPKYVMARCGDVLYVSFKGLQTYNFGSPEKSYRGEICSHIEQTAKKIPLKYFAREIIQDKRIVFTGHSSGGAIASLVMILLLDKFKQHNKTYLQAHLKCITFGLMPMAEVHFKQFVETIPGAAGCFCHIVQKNDIVPKLFGSCSMKSMQGKLWELVEKILMPTFMFSTTEIAPFKEIVRLLSSKFTYGGAYVSEDVGFKHPDIFGTYYILDTSKTEAKYSVLSAEQAAYALTVNESENLGHLQSQYLINHKLARYANEVDLAFIQDLPDVKKFIGTSHTTVADDITPKIIEVRFESIGEEVVAKIAGSNMWFVYNVSIEGVDGDGKDLEVNVMKSLESEVQTIMREKKIVHDEEVTVRVKTHFQNSKYLPATDVVAQTATYPVTSRQLQIAKYRPRELIELAYLCALLECNDGSYSSERFNAIKTFFKNAVSVVPLESLFYGIAEGTPEVMLQCCEILCSGSIPTTFLPSEFFLTGMEDALMRIRFFLSVIETTHGRSSEEIYCKLLSQPGYRRTHSLASTYHKHRMLFSMGMETRAFPPLQWDKYYSLLNNSITRIEEFLKKYQPNRRRQSDNCATLCNIDLEVIYPSTDTQEKRKYKMAYCKLPMTLLTEGKRALAQLSEDFIAEQTGCAEGSFSATNRRMLMVLTKLRNEFETCSTLLGTFMESQVHIPLERAGSDNYVNKIAKHANSLGLSVWSLLILPFEYLKQMIGKLSEEFGQFFIDFSHHHSHDTDEFRLPSSEHEFPDYDEKLEFLVASMKRSWTCNQNYVSYSLERQLEDQCKKRNILHNTPVKEILAQWNANFEDETLTFVPNQYRPLVARWIKWSLMINNLRESLASQTAIGVIGLVNSGKSKFVRAMFGRKTVTGTTDQKRTTVPLIYNLDQDIGEVDVIDFPGVDDLDKSIPELAKLLLSLTQIIVFVVDYRRAHTESTNQWLSILERENVPVLICLTFGDKLFAELMGKDGDCDVEKIQIGIKGQLDAIKEKIGQPEYGHQRGFKLAVFALDNDSNLNTEEGKKKLRKAGLSDELDVGRWIAEKFQDYDQNEVSQNVIKFIDQKEKSTLNPYRPKRGRQTPTVAAEGKDGSGKVVRSGCGEGTSGEP